MLPTPFSDVRSRRKQETRAYTLFRSILSIMIVPDREEFVCTAVSVVDVDVTRATVYKRTVCFLFLSWYAILRIFASVS